MPRQTRQYAPAHSRYMPVFGTCLLGPGAYRVRDACVASTGLWIGIIVQEAVQAYRGSIGRDPLSVSLVFNHVTTDFPSKILHGLLARVLTPDIADELHLA